jgi:hypothetical protein
MRLRREDKIFLYPTSVYNYRVENKDGQIVLSDNDDFFIYFKNVTFRPNGIIEGRYLGENPQNIIDDKCREIFYSDAHKWHYADCKKVRSTAKLVAVNNKKSTIVIIEE